VESVSPSIGLFAGWADFMKVITDAHPLRSRLWEIQQEALARLTGTLAEETGAAPGDPLPGLIAGQLSWLHATLMAWIGDEMVERRDVAEVSREALCLLDEMEDLLGEKVLNYATRPAG
jgi:hypothetical protein